MQTFSTHTHILRRIFGSTVFGKTCIHSSSNLLTFHEFDDKGGYPRKYDGPPEKKLSFSNKIRQGWNNLHSELGLLKDQVIEDIKGPNIIRRNNEVDVVWRFNGDAKCLNDWVVTCDSDYSEGRSTARLELSPQGKGIFSGKLDTDVIKDGKVKTTGYCNLKAVPKRRAFKRRGKLDWTAYTHLVLRVRGDGRCYLINIGNRGFWDLTWLDTYHYVLYTSGGPYWQFVKLPFSKFCFGSKGRIQDAQTAIDLSHVSNISISVVDNISGPFKLEIDYVGLAWDSSHFEKFAYELYDTGDLKF